MSHKFKV